MMKTEDPIEELFRKKSKEITEEKPNDLVWKRIEEKLTTQDKTETKIIFSLSTKVWLSAAAVALIIAGYSIFYIKKLGMNEKITSPTAKTSENINKKNLVENEKKEEVKKSAPIEEFVKNNEILKKHSKIRKKENESINSHSLPDQDFSPISTLEDFFSSQSKALDSLEIEEKLTFNSLSSKKIFKDSIQKKELNAKKENSPVGTVPQHIIESGNNIAMQPKLEEIYRNRMNNNNNNNNFSTGSEKPLLASSYTAINQKMYSSDKSKVSFRPFRFTVKTDILRTNFKLLKRDHEKIIFSNKAVVVSFQKVNSRIIVKTNEPNIDRKLLEVLEKNKAKIFEYYLP